VSAINLLPPWLIEKQRIRRLAIRLAAAQGVIFFVLTLVSWLMTVSVEKASLSAETLVFMLADERFAETDRIAEQINVFNAQTDLYDLLPQKIFEPVWLDEINASLPMGTTLSDIHITDRDIALSCRAYDWNAAESYRDALLGSGYFNEARFGKFFISDGIIHFELNLWAGP
jgi:Tfp pilus assembly protein PilN